MDREKVRRNIKALKLIRKIYIIEFIIFVIVTIIIGVTEAKDSFIVDFCAGLTIYILLLSLLLAVYGIYLLIPCLIYKIKNNNNDIKEKGYNYEPPYNYSPVIASYLLNKNIEWLVDSKAVQLNLLLNGYLDIDEDNKYIKTTKSIENLSGNESVIYNNINKNLPTKESVFIEQAYCDMEEMNLIKKRHPFYQVIKTFCIYLIFVVIFYMMIGILLVKGIESIAGLVLTFLMLLPFYIAIISGFPIMLLLIKKSLNKPYQMTKLGKDHAREWKKFKNFLEDYTLINQRIEEHYKLLGNYIPYAMSLGVAEKIEQNILENQKIIDEEYDKLKRIYELNK